MLGVHWIADASGCSPERLTTEVVREALIDLPVKLALTRVGEPQLFEHPEQNGAVAGIVLIAESHVSLHCFPDERALHVDVFSCKAMDVEVARRYVSRHFCAEAIVEQLLERGANLALHPQPATHVRRVR